MKLTFSPAAEADLLDIAIYIAEDNQTRALTFVDELEKKCEVVGRTPGIGTARPELGDGIRMLPYGRYLIFYREAGTGVRIERILHSARDIGGDAFSADDPHERRR
ncbi:type II toxin-antitoxin system RelE/ParE family toxin [Xylophilus sp. GW821-FHT01B05]